MNVKPLWNLCSLGICNEKTFHKHSTCFRFEGRYRIVISTHKWYILDKISASIVILGLDALDDGLVVFALPTDVLRHPRPHPLTRRQTDGRPVESLVVPQSSEHGTLDRDQLGVVLGSDKIQDAVAVDVGLIRRRCDDAVDAALQEPVGEELEGVGDVDGDALGVRFDVSPFAFGGAHL